MYEIIIMRIVHIITRFINGGADENTLYSCNWASDHGHEVILIHGEHTQPEILEKLHSSVQVIGVPQLKRKISPIDDISAFNKISTILRDFRPDILHTHTSKAGILGRLSARRAGIKGIVHGVHIAPFLHVGPLEKLVYVSLERLVARWTLAFVDVSEGMRDACLEYGIGCAQNHHLIHSGMALDSFIAAKRPENWREILGISVEEDAPPVVLMIAALESRKRHVELVKEFNAVFKRVPNARLLFAGEGPERAAIQDAIAASDRPDNIKLLGFHSDPASLIKMADICVLCSNREGLPRVVVQYIAGGRPVVISELPGIQEIVSDGVEGIVTPADDLSKTADAIARLLVDTALRNSLAQACQSRDLSSWSYQNMCLKQDAVYEMVLSGFKGVQTQIGTASV